MKKKVIVAVSVLVVLLGLALLLSYTFFALREVEIDYRTSHENILATDEEIIESGQIELGGTVFFRNKNKIEQNIESEYPYINVINIETVFPSKFVIHIAQRQEVYAVKAEEEYYICDEELKVLRIASQDEINGAIVLDGDYQAERLKVGESISFFENPKVYQAFYQSNLALGNQKDLIDKITLCKIYDEGVKENVEAIKILLKGGQTLTLVNPAIDLSYKVHMFMQVYANLFDMIGKESLQADGTKAVLTAENLLSCEIYINNYYTEVQNGAQNCYFKIFVAS